MSPAKLVVSLVSLSFALSVAGCNEEVDSLDQELEAEDELAHDGSLVELPVDLDAPAYTGRVVKLPVDLDEPTYTGRIVELPMGFDKPDLEPSCPLQLKPVCGVDGETYSNGCFAGVYGVEIAHNGPCLPLAAPPPNNLPHRRTGGIVDPRDPQGRDTWRERPYQLDPGIELELERARFEREQLAASGA